MFELTRGTTSRFAPVTCLTEELPEGIRRECKGYDRFVDACKQRLYIDAGATVSAMDQASQDDFALTQGSV